MAIIFLVLVFLAWCFYSYGKKVYAVVIFIFFLTSGFHLVPEEAMMLMTGFSKGQDYALILIAGCLGINFIFSKGRYFGRDGFTLWLFLFLAFLFVCILYSRYVVGCSFGEAIRACRQYLLVVAYFVFRNISREDLERLLKVIFVISSVLCGLYVLQVILSVEILNSMGHSVIKIRDWSIMRYYNQPHMMYFCAFLAIYSNIVRGGSRFICIAVSVLAILLGFNRSGLGFFIISLILGYVLRLSRVKQVKFAFISLAIAIPSIMVLGHNFMKSKTYEDLRAVTQGRFADANIDLYLLYNSTFAYRMGHLFERISYIEENPSTRFLGIGLIPEDSPLANQFGFILGLSDKRGDPTQLESPDICYSSLFLKFGYLGTALFLSMYIYMACFFFKRKKSCYALPSFLYLILSFGISFFSSNLNIPIFFILPMITMCLVRKDTEALNSNQSKVEEWE